MGVENFGKQSLFVENDDPKAVRLYRVSSCISSFQYLYIQAIRFVLGMLRVPLHVIQSSLTSKGRL